MENQIKILESLTTHFDQPCKLFSTTPVFGGDINQSFKVETNLGIFFIKENNGIDFPGMFRKEKGGLNELSKSDFKIPDVFVAEDNFLILEWLEKTENKDNEYWRNFGTSLAKQHQINETLFGFEEGNYIGSLPQKNSRTETWADFFIENRLEIQLKLALDSKKVPNHILPLFERLYYKLDNLFPIEKPSLLHGDLWNGNVMKAGDLPTIFDPAVYYGHREMDLAMTKLFGGFHSEMYHAYQETYPLENGFKERENLCNLYPLLVHVNLFGEGYVRQVEQILARFV